MLFIFILVSADVLANDYQLGVILGAPTGISGKVNLKFKRSIDMALAYSLTDKQGLNLHADYLIENAYQFVTKKGKPLDLYYGIGARLVSLQSGKHDGEIALGPRAPIGLNYFLVDPKLDIFGELALAFDVFPDTNLDLEGGLGIRYRF